MTAGLSACGKGSLSADSGGSHQVVNSCSESIQGSPWSVQVAGISPANHDSTTSLSQVVINKTGPLVGLGQAAPAGKEISVTIDMGQDLGQWGSLTLMAKVTQMPGSLAGSAFAYLVSLNDGVNELVNLTRSGAAGDCASKGYFVCSAGFCSVNSSCTIQSPSAFANREQWEQHQGALSSASNLPSINVFPTCNWSSGSPACAFNSTFFPSASPARLRFGGNYVAKYVLISDSYSSVSSTFTANLEVTVTKKISGKTTLGGAFDVNLILVGSKNIAASRTAKGQQNLNTLSLALNNYFSQSNVNVKVGAIHSSEFTCQNGGDFFANLPLSSLSLLLSKSSALNPQTEGRAVNVFLVSSIEDDSNSSDSNLTILGVDGAVGGPVTNGTAVSGLVVSTFDNLDQYNPQCPAAVATCASNQVDEAFHDLQETLVHELGHFMGLNHPSERNGTVHDSFPDTPICTATENFGGVPYLTINSCLNLDTNVFPVTNSTCQSNCNTYTFTFSPPGYSVTRGHYCPLATACGFNYMMWWTSKNFTSGLGVGDGTLFSPNEGTVINYHPLVQ